MTKQPKPSTKGESVPVTIDNFIRAESDSALGSIVKQGAFGKFVHSRELTPLDRQVVPRANRDTLYSTAAFDLDAGPVTITLPHAGERFMRMTVIDEDHYVLTVVYGEGSYTFTRDKVGTRYAMAVIRMFVDHTDSKELGHVHALQDAVKVSQNSSGRFEVPNWDQASQKKVRNALKALGETLPALRNAFGTKTQVDPVRHLIATATAWGGNPDKDAIYLNVTPRTNDAMAVYRLTVKDVPVDGFWSISVYNKEGYFQQNDRNTYTLNNTTAKKDPDGSVTIQFGGCNSGNVNCLPIMPDWNYMVRLYRPRPEILNDTWKFPEAQPVRVEGTVELGHRRFSENSIEAA